MKHDNDNNGALDEENQNVITWNVVLYVLISHGLAGY